MQITGKKNLSEEGTTPLSTGNTSLIGADSTTTKTLEPSQWRIESPQTRVEVLRSPEDILVQGTLDSMSIIDSSANVLHSQMTSLLKVDDPSVRKPGEWATQLAIQCGSGIAQLIKAKTDALKLLKDKK